jgi:hypothetical protein
MIALRCCERADRIAGQSGQRAYCRVIRSYVVIGIFADVSNSHLPKKIASEYMPSV